MLINLSGLLLNPDSLNIINKTPFYVLWSLLNAVLCINCIMWNLYSCLSSHANYQNHTFSRRYILGWTLSNNQCFTVLTWKTAITDGSMVIVCPFRYRTTFPLHMCTCLGSHGFSHGHKLIKWVVYPQCSRNWNCLIWVSLFYYQLKNKIIWNSQMQPLPQQSEFWGTLLLITVLKIPPDAHSRIILQQDSGLQSLPLWYLIWILKKIVWILERESKYFQIIIEKRECPAMCWMFVSPGKKKSYVETYSPMWWYLQVEPVGSDKIIIWSPHE